MLAVVLLPCGFFLLCEISSRFFFLSAKISLALGLDSFEGRPASVENGGGTTGREGLWLWVRLFTAPLLLLDEIVVVVVVVCCTVFLTSEVDDEGFVDEALVGVIPDGVFGPAVACCLTWAEATFVGSEDDDVAFTGLVFFGVRVDGFEAAPAVCFVCEGAAFS